MSNNGIIFLLGIILVAWMIGTNENPQNNPTPTTTTYAGTTTTIPNTATCTDSDGGYNKEVKGTISRPVSGGSMSYTDYCEADGRLREFFCSPGGEGNINNMQTVCGTGKTCSEGRCV